MKFRCTLPGTLTGLMKAALLNGLIQLKAPLLSIADALRMPVFLSTVVVRKRRRPDEKKRRFAGPRSGLETISNARAIIPCNRGRGAG